MPKYVFAYYASGEIPDMSQMTEEESAATMEAWGVWYGSMGAAVVDGGNPFSVSTTVTPDGSIGDAGGSRLTGYTIVNADDMAAAQEMAKGCPVLTNGINVDVYEAMDMG